MFGIVTADSLDRVLAEWKGHLDKVDKILERAQQRIAGQEAEIWALKAQVNQMLAPAPAVEPPKPVPVAGALPPEVRRAIAIRSGRGNVNRKALLETTARAMLDDPGADPTEVADLIQHGSGGFEV